MIIRQISRSPFLASDSATKDDPFTSSNEGRERDRLIMSKQFFYDKLRFTPKATRAMPTPYPREVFVEVPKDLAERKESEIRDEVLRKVFALDLARSAALRTFPTAEQNIKLYEEGP